MRNRHRKTLALLIASIGGFLPLATPALQAANVAWEGGAIDLVGNGNGLSAGGAGTWDTTIKNWDFGAVPYDAWVNANNDTAVLGGTAGTVTLGANITVGGLQFSTTGYTIATSTNTLTFGAADNTISLKGIATATISGNVGGSGNVFLTSTNPGQTAGTLALTGATSGGWTGTTTIGPNLTVTLDSAANLNQNLLNTSSFTLNGGAINSGIIANNANAAADRINNAAAWTVNSGTLTWGSSNAGGSYAETIGTVTLNRGQMNFVLNGNLSSGSQALTVGTTGVGLVQTGTSVATFSNAATALNSSIASGSDVIRVNGITTSTPAGEIIAPWATVGAAAGTQNDYAKYVSDGTYGYVVPAALTDTTEAAWVNSTTSAWSLNPGAGISLSSTRQAAAVKFYGASATLTLPSFNLETNGVFFSGANAMTIAATGTGALTTPTGGGNLYVTSGQANHTISAPINDNAGAVTLVVSGAGRTLTLSSTTSNYSGGTVLNSGVLATTADTNLGSGGGITVNGTATWNAGAAVAVTYNRSLTINEGGVLTVTSGNAGKTITGVFSGNGTIINTSTTGFIFNNTGNTFTGIVNNGYQMSFASLGDSSNPINLVNSNSEFLWTGAAKTFANRPFTIQAAGTGNINSSGSGALTIQQPLEISGAAGARTLSLGGSNTGSNVFAGNIANGTNGGTSVVSLTKAGASKWALSGTNTYSGTTINGFNNPANAGLVFQGLQALSPSTTLQQTHAGGTGGFGVISILDDGAAPTRSTVNVNMLASNTSHTMTLFVGNNNTANGGSSAGTTTGSTVTLGNLNFTQNAAGNTSQTLTVTGANSYRLQLNNINLPAFATSATTWNGVLNPTSAPLTVAGNVQQAAGANTGTSMKLTLDGTAATNLVSGNILDSADGSPKALTLTKSNSSTWTLSGTNTFSGGTTLSAGTLQFAKLVAMPATGAVAVGTGATLAVNVGGAGEWTTGTSGEGTIGGLLAGLGGQVGGTVTYTGTTTLGIDTSNAGGTQTYSGVIPNAGTTLNISKLGTGILVLDQANTYNGATIVNNGTLQVGAAGTIPTGAGKGDLTFNNAANTAIFDINGFDTTVNGLTQATASTTNRVVNNAVSTTKTLTVGNNNTTSTFAGVLADNTGTGGILALEKTGTGTLTLAGANTFTGTTTISGGTLLLGSANALGGNNPGVNATSAITMATGALLRPSIVGPITVSSPITTAGSVTIGTPINDGTQAFNEFILNGAIGGTGNVTFAAASNNNTIQTVRLGAASTYTGTTLIQNNAGTAGQVIVKLGVNNALPVTTVVTIDGNAGAGTGRVAEINMFGFSQELAGLTNTARALRIQRIVNPDSQPAATLTINNAADYTFGAASGANSGGFLGSNSSSFSLNASASNATNGNNFGLTKNGTGKFTLISANTYSGATKILGGVLSLGNASAMSQSPLDTTNSIAGDTANGLQTTVTTLTMGGLTGNKNLADVFTTTAGGYGGVTTLTLNPITGATPSYAGIIADGAAGMNLSKNGSGTQTLTGANTYTGTTTINAGTLQLGDGTSGNDGTITASTSIVNNAGLIYNRFGSASYGGVISGTGNVTKLGAGTQTLTGTNSYTGATTVSVGKLLINGDHSAATGAVNVSALATLGGSGTIGGLTTVASTGVIAPGNSTGNLTLGAGADLSAGGVYTWELGALSTVNAGTDFDLVTVSGGNLMLGGTSALTLDFGLVSPNGPNSADAFWTTSQTWKIIDVSGTGTNTGSTNLSAITNATYSSGSFTTSVGSGADAGDIFLVFTPGIVAGPSVWQGANNDPWTAAGSWSGSVPNSASAEAKFVSTGGTTALLDANQTVNKLTFDSTNPHTISGSNTLTLAGTAPTISTAGTNNATQTVAVNLNLAASTAISVQGGTLELNSPGNAVLGTGVTTTVATGATLSLGGAGNALSNGTSTHANVNNSGTLVAATAGKRVGDIDGATGTTTVTAANATLTANHIRQATLNIGAGNTVTVAANGGDTGTSVLTNLSINATGKLDLTNNDLIVDNGNLTTLTAKLASGLDITGSYGSGPGINGITSSTFANDPNFNTVLGIASNADLGYATFSGQTIDANDVLIKYTYFGDADLNGVVDGATDFDLYITGLTSGGSLGGWLYGDFDYNGTVDSATDFDLYITGLSSQGGPLLTGGGGSNLVQAVPEPSTFVLGGLALVGFAGVGIRRRRLQQYMAQH